jgi:hypothetical protein
MDQAGKCEVVYNAKELKQAEDYAREMMKKSKGNLTLETLYAQWALDAQRMQVHAG